MKICVPHWNLLRSGIQARGMSHLIGADMGALDPLINANVAICGAAIENGGLELMSMDVCPLCQADIHGGHALDWIRGCLDAQLEQAVKLGLVHTGTIH